MATPEARPLALAVVLLAGVEVILPWAIGGRSPAGQAGLVALVALAAAVGLFPPGHTPSLRSSPALFLAAILVAASALHTIYPDRTAQGLLLLLAYLLAGALAAHGTRQDPWASNALLTAILTSGILVSASGILRLLLAREGGLYANLLTGPFGYPNAAGGFLLLATGAALAGLREARRPGLRAAAAAAAVLTALGVVLTRSRGAILSGILGLAVWAALERTGWEQRRRLWLGVAGLGLLTLLGWALGWFPGIPRRPFGGGAEGIGDSSLLWRLQILRATWAMVREHPWWGVGPGGFPVALNHYQSIPYVSGENPHNLYLELAAEYGFPAGALVVLLLGAFLFRVGAAVRHPGTEHHLRKGLGPILAALVAFAAHSAVDLDWSFPAVAMTAAIMLGLASAFPQRKPPRRHRPAPIWRVAALAFLAVAAVLALSRYYASTLVTAAHSALTAGDTRTARRDLTWALRLNPWSFPAHQGMAWMRFRSGDLSGAIEVASRAAHIASLDPNGNYLVGEIALAAGRWDLAATRFRMAVDRAPAAQLRFHAGLVEAAARAGQTAEARWWYEQAIAVFTPDRVRGEEARCLAPGDRYLLARMSRIAARLYREAGNPSQERAATEQAQRLAVPDRRGICITEGRPGQRSPEETVGSFWRALAAGGWQEAGQFLAAEARPSKEDRDAGGTARRPRSARVTWVAALSGGERRATVRYEVEMETHDGRALGRCAQSDLVESKEGWFLERPPTLESESCTP